MHLKIVPVAILLVGLIGLWTPGHVFSALFGLEKPKWPQLSRDESWIWRMLSRALLTIMFVTITFFIGWSDSLSIPHDVIGIVIVAEVIAFLSFEIRYSQELRQPAPPRRIYPEPEQNWHVPV